MSSYDVWDTSNPARGDMAAVRHFADVMNGRATALNDIADRSTRAAAATESGGFLGAAGTMWRDVCRATIPPMVDQIVAVLARREAAARGFADIVDGMRASTIHANDLQHKASVARHQYEEMAPDMQGMYPGERLLLQVESDQREARALLHRLREQRAEAEQAFASVLNDIPDVGGVLSKDLMLVGAALPGSMTFADVRAATAVPDAIAATLAVQAGGNDYADNLKALEAALSQMGDNEAAWNQYYEAIGGEAVVRLVRSLADVNIDGNGVRLDNFDLAAKIAGELRHGLSVASENWDAARGEEFAQQMIDGSDGLTATDIGFFFGDPNHDCLGESLTVAMATDMDRLEREGHSEKFGGYVDGMGWSDNVVQFGMALADPGDGMTAGVFGDPSATIFESLSKYPEATAEWLLGGENGPEGVTERMQYWFGDRDSHQSGFLGPVSLLEGTEHLPGGVLDTSDYDYATWIDTARILRNGIKLMTMDNNSAFMNWSDNAETEGWVDGTLTRRWTSPAAEEAIARTLGNYLPFLAEIPMTRADDVSDSVVFAGIMQDGNFQQPVANITDSELSFMLKAMASNPDAVDIFKSATAAYQANIEVRMDNHTMDAGMGLDRIAATTGTVDAIEVNNAAHQSFERLQNTQDVIKWSVAGVGKLGAPGAALKVVSFLDDQFAEARTAAIINTRQVDTFNMEEVLHAQFDDWQKDADWVSISSGVVVPMNELARTGAIQTSLDKYLDQFNAYENASVSDLG